MTALLQSESYSEEQARYIYNCEDVDTKLLATAGSGKTFCIIQHLVYLMTKDDKPVTPESVAVLTFSKNAREDFVLKLKRSKYLDIVPKTCVFTIDSFAWKLLGAKSSTIDVSILSFTLMKRLEAIQTRQGIIEAFPTIALLKRIYVDEAQDLNDTQFRIISLLQEKCGCTIHLIGDPNQNIYQFRKSSDRYLVGFPAKTFYLTKNYRSKGHIVEFCSFLRPYRDVEITYNQAVTNDKLKITFYAYESNVRFEHYILAILHAFKARGIPLHKCAILAPTRGYVKDHHGVAKYKGLCYVSNLLYQHSIPFVQFYDDSQQMTSTIPIGSDSSSSNVASGDGGGKIKYRPVKNHINLMTYTSSKGLEWDYVIVMDANAHLITRRDYDKGKYTAEQYLLYVACSRPCKNLIIFTKRKYANPWFADIPKDKYQVAKVCEREFDFFDKDKLFDKTTRDSNSTPCDWNLDFVIGSLTEATLYDVFEMFNNRFNKSYEQHMRLCGTFLYSTIRAKLVGKFLTHFFFVVSTQSLQSGSSVIIDIRNVITSRNLLPCSNDAVIQWYFSCRETMTWEVYDQEKHKFGKYITNFVDNYFDRKKPFQSYTLVDKFYNTFIGNNIDTITDMYESYKRDPYNPKTMFYLVLISYAIQTTHYFYVHQSDTFTKEVLTPSNLKYLDSMAIFIKECFVNNIDKVMHPVSIPISEAKRARSHIDFITRNGDIYILKTSSSVSFKDMLKGFICNLAHQNNSLLTSFSFKILDLTMAKSHIFHVNDVHTTMKNNLINKLFEGCSESDAS